MNRIILPLDNKTFVESAKIIDQTHRFVWGYKIRRQILEEGLKIIGIIKRSYSTKVMVDFKLYDIPSAMDEAIKLFSNAGADIITVHCSAQYGFSYNNSQSRDKLAGVTVLTSFDEKTFTKYYRDDFFSPIQEIVKQMSNDASRNGYGYIVCSPNEVEHLSHISCKKICPGIRPEWYYGEDDQNRIATPKQAIKNGADLLVIGRPILKAYSIIEAIKKTNEEIKNA